MHFNNRKPQVDLTKVIRAQQDDVFNKASKMFMWAYLVIGLLGLGTTCVLIWAIIRLVLKYT